MKPTLNQGSTLKPHENVVHRTFIRATCSQHLKASQCRIHSNGTCVAKTNNHHVRYKCDIFARVRTMEDDQTPCIVLAVGSPHSLAFAIKNSVTQQARHPTIFQGYETTSIQGRQQWAHYSGIGSGSVHVSRNNAVLVLQGVFCRVGNLAGCSGLPVRK